MARIGICLSAYAQNLDMSAGLPERLWQPEAVARLVRGEQADGRGAPWYIEREHGHGWRMSGHDPASSARIWTEYWRSGRRGCLTDEAPVSAREHIEKFWRGWFRQLPQGARIVDLACGSGEVARIAYSLSEEARLLFDIEGVDLAQLDDTVESKARAIGTTMRLRGDIDIARLPFPDCSFDCAVSQFGIEYAEPQASCREVARVLKRPGLGLFVVHHTESAITFAAASRLQAFAALIGDGLLLDRARHTYEAIAQRAPHASIARRLTEFRRSVRGALDMHSAKWAWEGNLREILAFLSDLARNPGIYDPIDALCRLEAARNAINAWKERQQSQLAAARDENGMQAFAGTMRNFDLQPREIRVVRDPADGATLAWSFLFACPETP